MDIWIVEILVFIHEWHSESLKFVEMIQDSNSLII